MSLGKPRTNFAAFCNVSLKRGQRLSRTRWPRHVEQFAENAPAWWAVQFAGHEPE